MGANVSCNQCCHENQPHPGLTSIIKVQVLQGLDLEDRDQIRLRQQRVMPDPKVAKPVKQVIQLNSAVKDVYKRKKYNKVNSKTTGMKQQPYYLFEKRAYYDGEWKYGVPHGMGRMYYDNGAFFQGSFNKGVAVCEEGLYIYPDGAYYRGEIMNSEANGRGIYESKELVYEGEFRNNKPDGRGEQKFTTGQVFKGFFKNGVKSGYGRFEWPNKNSYEGTFSNGMMEGSGTFKTEKYIYKGKFKQNKKHGLGVIKYNSGNSYNGQFENDMMHGKGTFVWSTGDQFEGMFFKDKQDGEGKFILKSGDVKKGTWKQGKLQQIEGSA